MKTDIKEILESIDSIYSDKVKNHIQYKEYIHNLTLDIENIKTGFHKHPVSTEDAINNTISSCLRDINDWLSVDNNLTNNRCLWLKVTIGSSSGRKALAQCFCEPLKKE